MANNLKKEIRKTINSSIPAFELYKLYESYATHIASLLLAKRLHDRKSKVADIDFSTIVLDELREKGSKGIVFKDASAHLFSSINENECLISESFALVDGDEKIFLLPDKDKLLLMRSFYDLESKNGEYGFEVEIAEIGNSCKGRSFIEDTPCYTSFDGWDTREDQAFAFFSQCKLNYPEQITSSYRLTEQLKSYEGIDIRDILTPMSFEEISYRLESAKEEKAKQLALSLFKK